MLTGGENQDARVFSKCRTCDKHHRHVRYLGIAADSLGRGPVTLPDCAAMDPCQGAMSSHNLINSACQTSMNLAHPAPTFRYSHQVAYSHFRAATCCLHLVFATVFALPYAHQKCARRCCSLSPRQRQHKSARKRGIPGRGLAKNLPPGLVCMSVHPVLGPR